MTARSRTVGRRVSRRRLVVAAGLAVFLAVAVTPHVAGIVFGGLGAAAIVAPWSRWGRRLAGAFAPPAPPLRPLPDGPAPLTPTLAGVDGELAARRLRPLTPGQRAVIEAWAARNLTPYQPFPDDDGGPAR